MKPNRLILAAVALLLAGQWCHSVHAQQPIAGALPVTLTNILASIHPGHPRLMMTSNTVAVIKSTLATDPWLKERYGRQKKRADRALSDPVSTYQLRGGDGILDISRQILDRVATLAIVYRVEGDKKYLNRCRAELDAAAHFPDWHPAHFLDTAEMTAAFASGYDWLYDSWSKAERQTLREAIINKGLKPGLKDYRSASGSWSTRVNNWNVVCNGGLALGALAIAEDSPEIAGEILARGLKSTPLCLSKFAPDGAWPEGPMYWGYTTLYESMYLASLQTACGSDFGLGEIVGVDKGGWFPAYCNGAAGGSFNFADANEDRDPRAGPQLLWLARRFHEPRYAKYQIESQTGRVSALEMIWGPGIESVPWQSIEPDRYFRDVEVATMRDRWGDTNAWFVGFKAGSNAVNHSHLDIGSFVLEAKGVRWAVDLGPDDYDLPGYFNFNKDRWNYYRLRAEGHNTLVINPGNEPDQSPKGFGKITKFNSTPQGVEISADLTRAYPAANRVVRSISYLREKSVTINDVVNLKGAGDLWWFLQTRASIKPSSDGRTLTLDQEGQTLTLKLLQPVTVRFETGPAAPLPTSPQSPRQAANKDVTRVAIHLTGVRDATISVLFE